jgi:3-oxoacid CoA-transferase subunit A
MIKNWLVTGDTHSRVEGRLVKIEQTMPELVPAETALIILGDAGLNYYLSKHDWKNKHRVSKHGFTLYCLRGNHEARAASVKGMQKVWDENVHGYVWMEEQFPLIRYFEDTFGEYEIDGFKVLTIGGAYSVDKWYRLQRDWKWFADEQLTAEEMVACEKAIVGKEYDFVFTHTCPINWEPNDLFIAGIDQSKVDKTTEVWLGALKDKFKWTNWLFGHYHAVRIERPHVEQFYEEIELLTDVSARWNKYDETGELDWWLPKSPNFHMNG